MRGIERQADYYGFTDPAVAEQAVKVESATVLPSDVEVADLVRPHGVGIQAGMLCRERGSSFSRGLLRQAVSVDVEDYYQLETQGLSRDQARDELSSRYGDPELAKAFKKGWATSTKANRKDLEYYEKRYSAQYGDMWTTAFSDGWMIPAAVF